MAVARKFLFGEDFRQPRPEPERAGAEAAAVEAALAGAYERGLQAGRREAEAETGRRLADAVERLGAEANALLARADSAAEAAEAACLGYFDKLARRLAGSALREAPLAAVADAAAATFRHLRGVPHLAVRVDAALVDEAETVLRTLAREHGFEGRIIVMGEDDMRPGDVRLDWADGGLVLDRDAIETAVDTALAAGRQASGQGT